MIQKEQYKSLREELEELLIYLKIPRYVWYWPELLFNTLFLMCTIIYPCTSQKFSTICKHKKATRAWEITREIYG